MNKHDHLRAAPSGSVQRNLVQIFDNYVVMLGSKPVAIVATGMKWKRVTGSDPVDVYSVEKAARRRSLPSACKQIHAISRVGEATEDLMEMNFSSAAEWVVSVVPVDDENSH